MIKITLRGQGGELDCRVTFDEEDAIRTAVQDIVLNCILAAGDSITIEEVAQ
jgi:hypothetical protein